MIYKYYTADLKVLDGDELKTPSVTIKVWFYTNPVTALTMMKNQLELWGLDGHKVFNLRRIK